MLKAYLLLTAFVGAFFLDGTVDAQSLSLGTSLYPGFPFKSSAYSGSSGPLSSAQFQTDILPQSPEAEAMVKYTLLPVTLYSGLPQVSIPIYELKTPNLDIPISLSYNYNGFKPSETASSVGLGWNVQGGGVVMRHVKSRVDHMDVHVVGNDYDNYVNMNYLSNKQDFLQTMGLGEADGEPDLYIFNAPGLSGKFILMQGKAYMFPHQQIQITSLGYDNGFIITNEKGDKYYFEDAERSHHKQTSQFGEYVPDHNSAWFLSMIVSADLSDTIQYNYTTYAFHQPPVYSETLTLTLNQNVSPIPSQNYQESAASGDSILSLSLSSIVSKNAEVDFSPAGTPRTDVWITDSTMYPLGSVSVWGTGSVLERNFTLQHQYFAGKLGLTEVDETLPLTDSGDDTIMQRYTFQYQSPDTNISTIPGWNTHSVDYWGYYNGAQNETLFANADASWVTNQGYTGANRAPNFNYCVHNTLSKITYPTGGYDTLIYEQNTTGNYQVGPSYTAETSKLTVDWYDNSNLPDNHGTRSLSGSFSLNEGQMVHINYTSVDNGYPQTDPFLTIYNASNALVYASNPRPPVLPGVDSVPLPPGAYTYVVTCDSLNGWGVGINYNSYTVTNTLALAPGIRVKEIDSYDNSHPAPVLTKYYTYNNGTSLYNIGAHVSSVNQDASGCYANGTGNCPTGTVYSVSITTLQGSLNPSVSDLINNQFWYGNVEETDISGGSNGKTDYSYGSFTPVDPDVFLTQKTDYKYTYGPYGVQYVPLHQTMTNYGIKDVIDFQTITSTVTDQVFPASSCYTCSNVVATPDQTQPVVGVQNVYSATHNVMQSGYKYVQSTVDIAWDSSGANPVTNETDYYYDNPNHIFPTRLITHNSKGEQVTTQLKYPLDYPITGINAPHTVDSLFNLGAWYADSMYNNCYDNLVAALQPYQPYVNNETNFTNTVNSYNCEGNYATNSQNAFTARNTLWQNYLFSLDSAEWADAVAWHKGVYWMQANHVVSPVIEKYISVQKSDGNDYLVSASRDNYTLAVNTAGDTVAKRTGIQETELTAPMLKTGFLANIDSNYHNEVSVTYDNTNRMSSQSKVNDLAYSYLWGYRHQLVVAEVAGSDPATIASFVNQSVLDNPSNDQTLRTELNKVRTGLAGTKALVTTVTYDPLIGITSKTDAAGRTTYYTYDNLGRLVNIKDQDGNIVKTFFYHYAN
ncbi:RHS repeat domain-containing protein [Dinghuibacter silviterrae]|uniref:YD repeat-containing protein n=1 Tax=Dinghuibacter silviterrae TaxID=1539049 RepID=A0A4R8DNA8_9BACT|nr:RHS repeat domain-containing protein [Dinghuibacter silviterrae]TDW99185.1 YD repeat-containing protein [Dinghuibacter silviterrae]